MESSLLEMLPGEVAERLGSGRDVAIIPIGSVEQHGPHLLLGCDTFSTLGKCIAIARETGATILPLVPYTWVGCTNYFSGGVGVREEVAIRYIRAAVRGAWRAGYRRILIVNSHGGNFYAMRSLPRDMLAEEGIPVMVTYGDAGALDERVTEASGMTGGLRLLGREDLIEDVARYARAAVEEFGEGAGAVMWPGSFHEARRLGVIGQDYLDETRHVQPSLDYDPDDGVAAAGKIGRCVAGLLEEFGKLVDEITG